MIIKSVSPAGNHVCHPPHYPEKTYGAGTIWECDDCGKQAKLVYVWREGWIWQWLPEEEYIPHFNNPRRNR